MSKRKISLIFIFLASIGCNQSAQQAKCDTCDVNEGVCVQRECKAYGLVHSKQQDECNACCSHDACDLTKDEHKQCVANECDSWGLTHIPNRDGTGSGDFG